MSLNYITKPTDVVTLSMSIVGLAHKKENVRIYSLTRKY